MEFLRRISSTAFSLAIGSVVWLIFFVYDTVIRQWILRREPRGADAQITYEH